MKKTTLLISLILPYYAFACTAPPQEQHVNNDELIKRTSNILLAKVTNAASPKNEYDIEYTFEVVESIKGSTTKSFKINGHPLHEGGMRNFNHHFDKTFWEYSFGRESNDTDCEIHPSFAVGATYLIFLDKPYHSKSFEHIIRTQGDSTVKDKWLQYVQQKI